MAKGRRWHGAALTLQAVARETTDDETPAGDTRASRIGFTLTRKVGGAVIRNRARRRLKEAVRLAADLSARPAHDYVVIGRIEAVRLPFEALEAELARAFIGVHEAGKPRRPADRPPTRPRQATNRHRQVPESR